MRWFWGLILIIVGLVILGSNLGVWAGVDFAFLLSLWPLILVLFGIALLARRWQYGWMIVLASFLFAAGFLVYAYKNKDKINWKDSEFFLGEGKEYKISEDLPQTAESASIKIETGAVDLKVKADSTKLIEGTLNSNFSNPELEVVGDKSASVVLRTTGNTSGIGINLKNRLDLNLVKNLPLNLIINSGASTMDLDLSDAKLKSLLIETGASTLKLRFGEQIEDGASATIKAGASTIEIEESKNVGVKVTTKTGLSGKSFSGLDKIGDGSYQSKNCDQAAKKINILVDAGVSTINFTTY